MRERKRRGLHNITKKSKTPSVRFMVSGVSASCAVARTGWVYINSSFALRVLFYYLPQNTLLFTKNPISNQSWRVRRTDRKNYQEYCMLRHCAVDYNSGKKGNQENDTKKDAWCVLLSKNEMSLLWSRASGTCEGRSF